MGQIVFKTGNSLAVTIPSEFAQSVGIKSGDGVKVKAEEDKGKITYFFSGAKQLPLMENLLKVKKK